MFIHFFCLCPLSLTVKLNFDISKVAYYRISLSYGEKIRSSSKNHLCSIGSEDHQWDLNTPILINNQRDHWWSAFEDKIYSSAMDTQHANFNISMHHHSILSSPWTVHPQWALNLQILISTKETMDGPLQTPKFEKTVSSASNWNDQSCKLCTFFAVENLP